MSVEVFIYDSSCGVLQEPLNITASDKNGVVLDSGVASSLGNEWGVILNWTLPGARNIYGLLIKDSKGRYAPFDVEDLNGNRGGRVDAVIYALPQGAGQLSLVHSPSQLAAAIANGPWSSTEKIAVNQLVAVAGRVKRRILLRQVGYVVVDKSQQQWLWGVADDLFRQLADLGLSPSLIDQL